MRKNPYVYNKTIREAFEMLNAWEYERLDIDSTEKIHCSEEYTRNMEKLIRAQKRPLWNYTNTVGKKVAVIALVILLAFGASMSVSAVRKPVVEFIVNVYERFVEIFFGEDDMMEAPCGMDTIYALGNLPEGYELVESEIGRTHTKFVWQNKKCQKIIFSQYTLYGMETIDVEKSAFKIFCLDDRQIGYAYKHDMHKLFWMDDMYFYALCIQSEFLEQDVVDMVESIIEYDVEK